MPLSLRCGREQNGKCEGGQHATTQIKDGDGSVPFGVEWPHSWRTIRNKEKETAVGVKDGTKDKNVRTKDGRATRTDARAHNSSGRCSGSDGFGDGDSDAAEVGWNAWHSPRNFRAIGNRVGFMAGNEGGRSFGRCNFAPVGRSRERVRRVIHFALRKNGCRMEPKSEWKEVR